MVNYRQKTKRKDKSNLKLSGFTLVEVLVSVTLFSVIIISVTSLFKLAIDSQRQAIAVQNVQESLKYFLEMTAKKIRMAQRDGGVCSDVDDDKIFKVIDSSGTDTLFFKNYYGECVAYRIVTDSKGVSRFEISRSNSLSQLQGFISPEKINIDALNFIVRDNATGSQPLVIISIRATALTSDGSDAEMVLQTSISSRYYK